MHFGEEGTIKWSYTLPSGDLLIPLDNIRNLGVTVRSFSTLISLRITRTGLFAVKKSCHNVLMWCHLDLCRGHITRGGGLDLGELTLAGVCPSTKKLPMLPAEWAHWSSELFKLGIMGPSSFPTSHPLSLTLQYCCSLWAPYARDNFPTLRKKIPNKQFCLFLKSQSESSSVFLITPIEWLLSEGQ